MSSMMRWKWMLCSVLVGAGPLAAFACTSSTPEPSPFARTDAQSGVGPQPDAAADGPDLVGDGGEGGASSTSGYTMDGPARCCLQDAGFSCCEGAPPGTCFQYGFIGQCSPEGKSWDPKGLPACLACCEGLTPVRGSLNSSAVCDNSTKTCTRCGDGTCGVGEDWCNCPSDCPPDAGT